MVCFFRSALFGACVVVFVCGSSWAQLPPRLLESPTLRNVVSRLVPPDDGCSGALLLPVPTQEDRSYWDFVNKAILARVDEKNGHVSTDEVEHHLELLLTETKQWLISPLTEVSKQKRFVDIHVFAIDLMAQLHLLQHSNPRESQASKLRAYEHRLLDLCLELDALATRVADASLSPLLLRLIDELSNQYFLLNKHLFRLELNEANDREGGVPAFLHSHILTKGRVLENRLKKSGSELGEYLRSTLDGSTFISLVGATVSAETSAGPILVSSWVDRVVAAAAWTQSLFLVGYFRRCYQEAVADLTVIATISNGAKSTLAELNRCFNPLLKEVSPTRWGRFLSTPGLEAAAAHGSTKVFFGSIVPLLEQGQYNPFNLLILKNALCDSIGNVPPEDT